MKLKRLSSGVYQSTDGRVLIQKEITPQSHGPDETSWSIIIDGKELFVDSDTKKDAVERAKRIIELEGRRA